MNPQRWHVPSLRRFRHHEVMLYGYGAVGGLLSLIFFVSVVLRFDLWRILISPTAWSQDLLLVKIFGTVLLQTIGRAIFWLPQFLHQVLLGEQTPLGWLLGYYTFTGWVP